MGGTVDPDYIKYLLDPEGHSYYFWVGNEKLAPLKKVGVVRKMLAAHSEVFRAQVIYGRRKTEKPEHISDLFPDTFENLLRFAYGHDTTRDLTFDEADDLLYAAHKYIMPGLLGKVAMRLMQLVDYNNICVLLNNPACYEVLEMKSELSRILQSQTDKVLMSKQFLNCCPEAVVRILEQETLNVRELDVWNAAVNWAHKEAPYCIPGSLRKQLKKPLEHIRICSIPLQDLAKSVVPTKVLSSEEVDAVCRADRTLRNPPTLPPGLCTIVKPRNPHVVISGEVQVMLKYESEPAGRNKEGMFILKTKEAFVEITVLSVLVDCALRPMGVPYKIRLSIKEVNSKMPSTVLDCKSCRGDGGWLMVPVSQEGKEVLLKPMTKYEIHVFSNRVFGLYKWSQPSKSLVDFDLEFSYGTLESAQPESSSGRQDGEFTGQEMDIQPEVESRQQENSSSQQEAASRQQECSPHQQDSQVQQETNMYLCPVGYIFYRTKTVQPTPQPDNSFQLSDVG